MRKKRLLKKLKHRLLVSCCNKEAGLFELHFHPLGVSIRKLIHGDVRGIAKVPGGYILARNAGILTRMDEEYRIIRENEVGDWDFHGVAVDGDILFVVETNRNAIGMYDIESLDRLDEIRLSPEDSDVLHLNDVAIKDGVLDVSMFSERLPWREVGIEEGLIQSISLSDPKERKIIANGLMHPHSLMWDGDDLWYCESSRYQAVKFPNFAVRTGGFTRGIAKDGNVLFMGISNSRNEKWVHPHPCGVNVVSLKDKENVFVRLPAQEVYGILLI